MEEDADLDYHHFEDPEREIPIRRKQISLCRHKLQTRAYPRFTKVKKAWRSPEQILEPENPELDHEWLQLIQLERAIDEHKKQLLNAELGGHEDPDEENKPLWEDEKGPAKQNDDLDDGDLEDINDILSSFSRPIYNHENSNKLKLKNVTPEDALVRALASQRTPPEFNLTFNQKLTTRGFEKTHFSYFPNIEEEGAIKLGDYFSDDEEDDTWDQDTLTSRSKSWSHTELKDSEINFPLSQPVLSEWNPVISGLDTIYEARFEKNGETNKLNHISGLSEETQLGFSTWQPFIPREHAFQNYAAQSQPSDFLSQASSSQEPTLIQILTIMTSMLPPTKQTSPQPETSLSPPKDWPSSRPATRPSTTIWMKLWTESTRMCNKTKNWQTKFPDHQEQSEPYRPWKPLSPCSKETNHNQNTKHQNTPPVTGVGGEPQGCIRSRSRSYSTMKSKRNTTEMKSWETKWRKFYNKTPTYQTKSRKNTKPRQKNSRNIQLWLWSQTQSPPTCSKPERPDHQDQAQPLRRKRLLNGSYECWRTHHSLSKQSAPWERHSIYSQTQPRKISKLKSTKTLTTGKLSPKRRSESEGYNQQSENYNQYKIMKSKNDIKSENEDIEVKNEGKLRTLLKTAVAKVTARTDEVKALEKTLKEFRVKKEKQIDKKIEAESSITLPPHFAAKFDISILTFTIFIFTFDNFITIFNPSVSDHHFQTFTIGDLSDCKAPCLARQTISAQTKTTVNALANPDSIQFFKVPEMQPDPHSRNLHRNLLVPKRLLSGPVRKSENDLHNDSFIFHYLDFSR